MMNNHEVCTYDTDDYEMGCTKWERERFDIGPIPTENDTLPELHGWFVTTIRPNDPYMDPALGVGILSGESVVGHPRIQDGCSLRTTALLYLVGEEAGRAYAKTTNRWYRLMAPHANYVKFIEEGSNKLWFPQGIHQNTNRRFQRREDGGMNTTIIDR
jgi:hypothetical protein